MKASASAPPHSPGSALSLWQPSNKGQAKVRGKEKKKEKKETRGKKKKTHLKLQALVKPLCKRELLRGNYSPFAAQTPLQPLLSSLEKLAALQPPAAGTGTGGGGRDQVLSGAGRARPDTSTTILCPPPPVTSRKVRGDAELPEEQQTHSRKCWKEAQ